MPSKSLIFLTIVCSAALRQAVEAIAFDYPYRTMPMLPHNFYKEMGGGTYDTGGDGGNGPPAPNIDQQFTPLDWNDNSIMPRRPTTINGRLLSKPLTWLRKPSPTASPNIQQQSLQNNMRNFVQRIKPLQAPPQSQQQPQQQPQRSSAQTTTSPRAAAWLNTFAATPWEKTHDLPVTLPPKRHRQQHPPRISVLPAVEVDADQSGGDDGSGPITTSGGREIYAASARTLGGEEDDDNDSQSQFHDDNDGEEQHEEYDDSTTRIKPLVARSPLSFRRPPHSSRGSNASLRRIYRQQQQQRQEFKIPHDAEQAAADDDDDSDEENNKTGRRPLHTRQNNNDSEENEDEETTNEDADDARRLPLSVRVN